MFALDLCRARLTYTLTVVSPLHVGSKEPSDLRLGKTKETKERGADYRIRTEQDARTPVAEVTLPVFEQTQDRSMRFLIPGSSIRGAMRHFLHRYLARVLADLESEGRVVAKRFSHDGETTDTKDGQRQVAGNEADFGHLLIRMLFGSEARRGQLAVGPATLKKAMTAHGPEGATTVSYSDHEYADLQGRGGNRTPHRDAQLRLITQNRLDRPTQSSADGLRTIATLAEGQTLTGTLRLRNFAMWQFGLLAITQQAINEGRLGLGAKTGVGLGRVALRFTQIDLAWHAMAAPRADEACYGIGIAAERMGLLMRGMPIGLGQEATPESETVKRLRLRGQRMLGWDADQPNVALFLIDPDDKIQLPISSLARENEPNPLLACGQRLFTSQDEEQICRIMEEGVDRLPAVFQESLAPEESR